MSWDSSVGIGAGYGREVGVRVLVRARIFSFSRHPARSQVTMKITVFQDVTPCIWWMFAEALRSQKARELNRLLAPPLGIL
jgi:hypothetical protein